MQLFSVNSLCIGNVFSGTQMHMTVIGSRVDETGTLISDGGDFALRRDIGGRRKLDLHRVQVDHVEKRVRTSGIVVADDLVDVDGLGPDLSAL